MSDCTTPETSASSSGSVRHNVEFDPSVPSQTLDSLGLGQIFKAKYKSKIVVAKMFKPGADRHILKSELDIVQKAGAILTPQPLRIYSSTNPHPNFPKQDIIMYEYGGISLERAVIERRGRSNQTSSKFSTVSSKFHSSSVPMGSSPLDRSRSLIRLNSRPASLSPVGGGRSPDVSGNPSQNFGANPSPISNVNPDMAGSGIRQRSVSAGDDVQASSKNGDRSTSQVVVDETAFSIGVGSTALSDSVSASLSDDENGILRESDDESMLISARSDTSSSLSHHSQGNQNGQPLQSHRTKNVQILHDEDCGGDLYCSGMCLLPIRPIWKPELLLRSLYSLVFVSHMCGLTHNDIRPRSFVFREDPDTRRTIFRLCNFARSAVLQAEGGHHYPFEELHDPRFQLQANLFSLASTLFWLMTGGCSVPGCLAKSGQLPKGMPHPGVISPKIWYILCALWDRQATHAAVIEAFDAEGIDWRMPRAMLGSSGRLPTAVAREAEVELDIIHKTLTWEARYALLRGSRDDPVEVSPTQLERVPEVDFYTQILLSKGIVDHEVTSSRAERRVFEAIKRLMYYVTLRLPNLRIFVPALRVLLDHYTGASVVGPYIGILLRLAHSKYSNEDE